SCCRQMRETPRPWRSHRVYRTCREESRWKSSSCVARPFLRKPADHSVRACRWSLGSPRSRECGDPLGPFVHVRANERTAANSIVDEVAHRQTLRQDFAHRGGQPVGRKWPPYGPRKLPFAVCYILFLFLA